MSIFESTFEKHKKLMLESVLTEMAPPFNSGGIYFRIMTGNHKEEDVIEKMKQAYSDIEVYRDNAMTGNEANSPGATLLLKNKTADSKVYKDLLDKKIIKIIEWPKANPRLGSKGIRFYRLLKSPKVEGYISNPESHEIMTFDGVEADLDPDGQGVTITVYDSLMYGGGMGGGEQGDKFDEYLIDKKILRLVGIIK